MRTGLMPRAGGIALLAFLLFGLVGPVGAVPGGGDHSPGPGCVKLEEPKDIPSVTRVVLESGIVVEFTWLAKPGEPGEWIGFDWAAAGGSVSGTVKASTEVFDWGPAVSGTFMVPALPPHAAHAISYVIVCSATEPLGSITVVKDARPDAPDVGFEFGGTLGDFVLIDDGMSSTLRTITFDGLAAGVYSITEEWMPDGWELTAIDCGTATVGYEDDSAVIDLATGQHVTCTFTNETVPAEPGSITVIKRTSPSTDDDFEFSLEPGSVRVVGGDGDTYTWRNLDAGRYELAERLTTAQLADGWYLSDVSCDVSGTEVDMASGSVAFDLAQGADVRCTFWNQREGVELGAIGDYVWIDADGEGDQDADEKPVVGVLVELLDGDGTLIATTKTGPSGLYGFYDLPEGDYRVRFTGSRGWSFTNPDMVADTVDSDAVSIVEVDVSGGATVEVGTTATFHLPAGAIDTTRDAGMFKVKVLPQVVTTSTTSGTLPFTGTGATTGLAGLAGALLSFGWFVLLLLRRRDDEPLAGWSHRLP